jgi:5-methylcytosine-specific restriction endonuclease McrA
LLADGRLHLTGIAKLATHLTRENREALLKRVTHRTKRQIEELVAELAPRPDASTLFRKISERRVLVSHRFGPELSNGLLPPDGAGVPALEPGARGVAIPAEALRPDGVRVPSLELRPDRARDACPTRPAPVVVHPLAPARYRVQFTASAELCEKLERLQGLMRSAVPDGDLATLIEQAVTEKLERLEARRYARTRAPRKDLTATDTSPSTRHIPAAVRRAVHERDGNRCQYTDAKGRRCSERHRLEYHHRHPFGLGGDHSPANIRLMCRAHNQFLATHDYGTQVMARGSSRSRHQGSGAGRRTAAWSPQELPLPPRAVSRRLQA